MLTSSCAALSVSSGDILDPPLLNPLLDPLPNPLAVVLLKARQKGKSELAFHSGANTIACVLLDEFLATVLIKCFVP